MELQTKRGTIFNICLEIFLWLLSLSILCPIAVVVVNSLKTAAEADYLSLELPAVFQFRNYVEVFQKADVVRCFGNSVVITGVTVLLCVVLSSMAAYVLSRNRNRLSRFLFYLLLLGLVFNIAMIPTIKIMQSLKMMNTLTGLILVYTATSVSFCVFIYHGFVPTISTTIDEAAIIDGCSPLRVFFQVIFPLLKPVNATIVIAVFVSIWNEFRMPLYLMNDPKRWPITMTIYNFCGRYSSQWNMVFADIVLVTLPIVIIYFLCQKYIIDGMTAGAVKG